METPPPFDADRLDALVGQHANEWYRRGCSVGVFILTVPEGEYRSRLVGYLGDFNIGHSALAKAIEATGGPTFRPDGLRRHRLKQCSCGEDTWAM